MKRNRLLLLGIVEEAKDVIAFLKEEKYKDVSGNLYCTYPNYYLK